MLAVLHLHLYYWGFPQSYFISGSCTNRAWSFLGKTPSAVVVVVTIVVVVLQERFCCAVAIEKLGPQYCPPVVVAATAASPDV